MTDSNKSARKIEAGAPTSPGPNPRLHLSILVGKIFCRMNIRSFEIAHWLDLPETLALKSVRSVMIQLFWIGSPNDTNVNLQVYLIFLARDYKEDLFLYFRLNNKTHCTHPYTIRIIEQTGCSI